MYARLKRGQKFEINSPRETCRDNKNRQNPFLNSCHDHDFSKTMTIVLVNLFDTNLKI